MNWIIEGILHRTICCATCRMTLVSRQTIRIILVLIFSLLLTQIVACGEDSFTSENPTGTTPPGGKAGATGLGTSQTGTPYTIAISFPFKNSIEDLGGGFYRRIGTAEVTDKDGNSAPDGTVVNFNIIDSIVAEGIIDNLSGDSIGGSTLTDTNATLGGGTASPSGGFDGAYVYRNSAYHVINEDQPDSLLLLHAEEEDKYRKIASVVSNNTLGVVVPFRNPYPGGPYENLTTTYVVGASLLGAKIDGVDNDGLITDLAKTVAGTVTFKVTYPANVDTIRTGCGDVPRFDVRSSPPTNDPSVVPIAGTARTYLIAQVENYPEVVYVDSGFCFSSIAGWTLKADPEAISGAQEITIVVRDGGDTVILPYTRVKVSVNTIVGATPIVVTPAFPLPNEPLTSLTNSGGVATFIVTDVGANAGDKANIVFSVGDPNSDPITVKYAKATVAPPVVAP